ncbi:chemotaxis protein CheD [Candidatus Bathyarchaeota archaeon]|nr:chemotaxis protein CheD [Candidatus Bathyarchaeota archaeon]
MTQPLTTIQHINPHISKRGLANEIRVGMSEVKIAVPPAVLITTVGSCIALCMYIPELPLGGMAHIVLPVNNGSKSDSPFKFASTAVPALVSALISKGAKRHSIEAKIAGGANMFPTLNYTILNIGKNNIDMTKTALAKEKIPLVAEDVGGTHGRRIEFDVSSGKLKVSKINGEVKIL